MHFIKVKNTAKAAFAYHPDSDSKNIAKRLFVFYQFLLASDDCRMFMELHRQGSSQKKKMQTNNLFLFFLEGFALTGGFGPGPN